MSQGRLSDSLRNPGRFTPVGVSRRPAGSFALAALLSGLLLGCGIIHVHNDADPGKLSTAEADIHIFFKDQKLPCENYVDLGHIQAVSGEELEPDEDQEERATMEAAISWLRVEAHKRGASAVIIDSRTQNKEQTAYLLVGRAIRCHIEKD
jgi:hypothetical protein